MAIQKQPITINFAQGLDTKTDPWQVPVGRFLQLVNTQFDTGGMLQKRNGYARLTNLDSDDARFLTTFNGNLTAIGTSLSAYIQGSDTWVNKGPIQPCQLSTLPLIRNSLNQTQCDAVVASNGLACVAYTESLNNSDGTTSTTYKYAIIDSATGQNVVGAQALTSTGGTVAGGPKVFILRNRFVMVYPVLITAAYHLQYTAVNINDPTTVIGPVDITDQYEPTNYCAFDGVVVNNSLYLAWNSSDIGDAVEMTYIDSTLTLHSVETFANYQADVLTIAADTSGSTPTIWVGFVDLAGPDLYVLAVNAQLDEVLAPTDTGALLAADVPNMCMAVQDDIPLVFVEGVAPYGVQTSLDYHYISTVTLANDGTITDQSDLNQDSGVASRPFIINDTAYLVVSHNSTLQPTYFLMSVPANNEDGASGQVVAKFGYQNGGGNLTQGVPAITQIDDSIFISYLVKDQILAVNKSQNADSSSNVYASLGVNLVELTFDPREISSVEIGGNLQLSGGFMWAYDGVMPVESGFFLYPENVVATAEDDIVDASVGTTNMSATLTGVTSSDVVVGMNVSGTGIQANSVIIGYGGANEVIMNQDATATATITATFTGNMEEQEYFYVVVWEWTDNQGNIIRSAPSVPVSVTIESGDSYAHVYFPKLAFGYKTEISAVIYRWSTAQQTYYQVTPPSSPIIFTSTPGDSNELEFFDIYSDAQIVGNNILYTTGGILENISPSAIDTAALFQSRLFYVTSENKNVLGFSQIVLPGTPVETSDLLTIFVAPTTAAQTNTGPLKVLAPMDDKLILMKKNALYYINGAGPDATGANNQYSEPTFISSTVGCENPNSLVFIPQGLMFESNKGIWLLGRDLSTKFIGADVQEFTQDTTVNSAVNVPGTNQVRFTMASGITVMYDYFYNQWGTFEGVPAISSTLYQDKHTFLNSLGQILQETPGAYLDGSSPVLMKFTTSWLNVAGLQGFERAYFFYLLGKYLTPHKLTVQVSYDYNESPTQSTVFTPDNFSPAYGLQEGPYGSGVYGGGSNVEQGRIFFDIQKCQSFKLTIQESFDSSYGVAAGAGLTLSGLDVLVGIKGNYPRLKASRSFS